MITKYVTTGSDKKLTTAANPEIFFMIKTRIHINTSTDPSSVSIAMRNPNEVATPLPPLKLLNIENICPANKKNDNRYKYNILRSHKKNIGMKPFKKSPAKVRLPAKGPDILNIFVAPGLFDPDSLGSLVDSNLCTINANGREPIK